MSLKQLIQHSDAEMVPTREKIPNNGEFNFKCIIKISEILLYMHTYMF